ncbi:CAMK family protein kinase [Tritrichomonas foetus]|uniref:CAMK family protein kinase n=1 Tax=Tritrichomonas foetus TaxID=1144522 RepID=A0A1J4KR05_9EUKA|nr:CAMK family protein kinase [Tritrichomonas foetus]|eukprot:OHT13360.1 CAMK family protein kinase [Tritrichomonas foetus]
MEDDDNICVITPSRLGPYQMRGTIGQGAFSVVKLAYNEEQKRFFACKIIPKTRLLESEMEERFETEIRVNQRLHHPNIVQISDLLKDSLNYYIFMEFCSNGDFFQYIIDNETLSEQEAAKYMKQILNALKYVHSNRVAHRDLKPENLLLDDNFNLKISDFGLSRFVDESGLVETPCGSPCYASPECISGEPYEGQKSDIWSCGVIIFAALTGQLPWTKKNQHQLFKQIKKGEYTIPHFLSSECTSFISGLMTVNTEQRLTIEEALIHPWIIKNASLEDTVQSPMIFYNIGSKKVDNFFDESTPFEKVEECELYKNVLHKFNTFGNLAGIIKQRVNKRKKKSHSKAEKHNNTETFQNTSKNEAASENVPEGIPTKQVTKKTYNAVGKKATPSNSPSSYAKANVVVFRNKPSPIIKRPKYANAKVISV